jgi:uroporphyrinogen-III synthase
VLVLTLRRERGPGMNEPLAGRHIAIAEARELDVFAALLERRGARVLRYPLVQIVDAPDPAPILEWCRRLSAGGCDDLILLTGEGLHRLCSCMARHEPTLTAPFVAALGRMRKITRGPKPARALRQLGLAADLPAAEPTTAGVIQTLRGLDLRGRRVGVQLYGDDPNEPLRRFLSEAGAVQLPVAPYRYLEAASATAVRELLERMRAGSVDAIAFTSKAQVERLFRAADPEQVRLALEATQVAAIGPIVAAALAAYGVAVRTVPDGSWFMKPLAAALAASLQQADSPPPSPGS